MYYGWKLEQVFNDNSVNNVTKLILAAESVSKKFVVLLHSESKGYAVKYFDGTWKVINFSFLNTIAGLGSEDIAKD